MSDQKDDKPNDSSSFEESFLSKLQAILENKIEENKEDVSHISMNEITNSFNNLLKNVFNKDDIKLEIGEIKLSEPLLGDPKVEVKIKEEKNDASGNNIQKLFKCDLCGCENKDATEMMDHRLLYHDKAFGDLSNFTCRCGQYFMDEEELYMHEDVCVAVQTARKHPSLKKIKDEQRNNINYVKEPRVENKQLHEIKEVKEVKEVDNIPTTIYGKHICPVCNKKYSTQYNLGEHFVLSHSSYESQLILDSKKGEGGFPGFNILEYIGMIEKISYTEFKSTIDESCIICNNEYINDKKKMIRKTIKKTLKSIPAIRKTKLETLEIKINDFDDTPILPFGSSYEEPIMIDNNVILNDVESDSEDFIDVVKRPEIRKQKYIEMSGYYSDSEIKHKKKKSNDKYSKCDMNLYLDEDIPVNCSYIQNSILWNSPYRLDIAKLMCCGVLICTDCLEKYIKEKNDIVCPFCKFDHNKRDQEYIKFYEVSHCKRSKWIEWWKKHYEILEKGLFDS
jgi:glutaredoxin